MTFLTHYSLSRYRPLFKNSPLLFLRNVHFGPYSKMKSRGPRLNIIINRFCDMWPSLKRKIKPQVGLLLLTLEGATKKVIQNRLTFRPCIRNHVMHSSMVNFTFIRGEYFVDFSEIVFWLCFFRGFSRLLSGVDFFFGARNFFGPSSWLTNYNTQKFLG